MMASLVMACLITTQPRRYKRHTDRDSHLCSMFMYAVENLQNIGRDIWNDAWADCLAVGLLCKSELHSVAIQGL